MTTTIGALGSPERATVDLSGNLTSEGWSLEWRVRSEDRWHDPAHEVSTRQALVSCTPVVETLVRVAGGDVASRAYVAIMGGGPAAIVEVHNRTPVPVAVAWTVHPESTAVMLPGPPRDPTSPAGTFVYPVPHSTKLRIAVPLGLVRDEPSPPSDSVVRGWEAVARNGVRLDLPAGRLADAIASTRNSLLLAEGRDWPDTAGRTDVVRLRRLIDEASATFTWPEAATMGEFLRLACALLVTEDPGQVVLCAEVPAEWDHQPLEVHGAPTSTGRVSFAVRWHGDRPALLWDVSGTRRVRVTAPGLDPAWSSTEATGEQLLGTV